MPNAIQAVILGLIQGITEFLPVSSSGHLVLAQRLLGLREPALTFDIALHLGTLVAVLLFFRRDIAGMVQGILGRGPERTSYTWLLVLIILGSVPTAVVGLLFKDSFEAMFASVTAVGVSLLITAALLLAAGLAGRPRRGLEETRSWHALLIGLAQGLAITPGISRSGSTISTALLLGLERELAVRFSFLLSIPAILGAVALQALDLPPGLHLAWTPLLLGALVAGVSGWLALRLLLGLVRRVRLLLRGLGHPGPALGLSAPAGAGENGQVAIFRIVCAEFTRAAQEESYVQRNHGGRKRDPVLAGQPAQPAQATALPHRPAQPLATDRGSHGPAYPPGAGAGGDRGRPRRPGGPATAPGAGRPGAGRALGP